MISLHNITNRALAQWIKATGVDPSTTRWTWNSYEIHQINEYITQAQDLDPTGLTAFMVVRAVARDYITQHKFAALPLIMEDRDTLCRIEELRELLRLVSDSDALACVNDFQDHVRKAAEHYGVGEKLESTIADMDALSHIRRDALVSSKFLRRHTFSKGRRSETPLKVNEAVVKLWNMNSLVRMAMSQPTDGITIVMVRDPIQVGYSFFCFLIKDGENITIWTDKEPCTNPMQKARSRARMVARRLEERSARLRFPYQLLEVRFGDENRSTHEIPTNAIVRTNMEAVRISTLQDLEPDQILWVILALDVLTKEDHDPKLSMTGEAMTTHVLTDGTVAAKTLTHSDVNNQKMAEQIQTMDGFASTKVNDWMEERYKDQVDPALYNLTDMARPAPESSLTHVRFSWEVPEEKDQNLVLLGGEIQNVKDLLPKSRGLRRKNAQKGIHLSTPELQGLDPVAFGTPEEMEADRLWIARWNQAQAIGMAAQAEFDRRRVEVCDWYRRNVEDNFQSLVDHLFQGSWKIIPTLGVRNTAPRHSIEEHRITKFDSLIRWYRKNDDGYPPLGGSVRDHDAFVTLYRKPEGRISRLNPIRCWHTDHAANHWVLFQPHSPDGIAALAGVPVSELPELLEHWNPNPPYHGNTILDRTDPLDSEIDNPWNALSFSVILGLSKRALQNLKKGYPQAQNIHWEEKNEWGF